MGTAATAVIMAPRASITSRTRTGGSLKKTTISSSSKRNSDKKTISAVSNKIPSFITPSSSSEKRSGSDGPSTVDSRVFEEDDGFVFSRKIHTDASSKAQLSKTNGSHTARKTQDRNGSYGKYGNDGNKDKGFHHNNFQLDFDSEEEPPPPPSPPVPAITRKRGSQKIIKSPVEAKRKKQRVTSKDIPDTPITDEKLDPALDTRGKRKKTNNSSKNSNTLSSHTITDDIPLLPVTKRRGVSSQTQKKSTSEHASATPLPSPPPEPEENSYEAEEGNEEEGGSRNSNASGSKSSTRKPVKRRKTKSVVMKRNPRRKPAAKSTIASRSLRSSDSTTNNSADPKSSKSTKQSTITSTLSLSSSNQTKNDANQSDILHPKARNMTHSSSLLHESSGSQEKGFGSVNDSENPTKKPRRQNINSNQHYKPQLPYSPTDTRHPVNTSSASTTTQISLPITDTPVIRRNQEMRRQQENKTGRRRSSLGNRGKRTSSIGNGFVAVPHESVDPSLFYKHLDSELPEPHRLKQLLVWSARRLLETQTKAYNEKKADPKLGTEEKTAVRIARLIQEEIVRDLADGKIGISWWNRDDETGSGELGFGANGKATTKEPKKLKPNIHNVTNLQNMQAYERKLKALQHEKNMWIQEQLRSKRMTEAVEKLGHDIRIANNSVEKMEKRVQANNGANSDLIDMTLKSNLEKFGSLQDPLPLQNGKETDNSDEGTGQTLVQKAFYKHPVLQTGLGALSSHTKKATESVEQSISSIGKHIEQLADFTQQVDAVARTSDAYSKASIRTVALELDRYKEAMEYENRLELFWAKKKKKQHEKMQKANESSGDLSLITNDGEDSDLEASDFNKKANDTKSKPIFGPTKHLLKNSALASIIMESIQTRREKEQLQSQIESDSQGNLDKDYLGPQPFDNQLHELVLEQAQKPTIRDILRSISRLENVETSP